MVSLKWLNYSHIKKRECKELHIGGGLCLGSDSEVLQSSKDSQHLSKLLRWATMFRQLLFRQWREYCIKCCHYHNKLLAPLTATYKLNWYILSAVQSFHIERPQSQKSLFWLTKGNIFIKVGAKWTPGDMLPCFWKHRNISHSESCFLIQYKLDFRQDVL